MLNGFHDRTGSVGFVPQAAGPGLATVRTLHKPSVTGGMAVESSQEPDFHPPLPMGTKPPVYFPTVKPESREAVFNPTER